MQLNEYIKYDAMALAELVRTQQVSAKELASCAQKRCEDVNPAINAVLEVFDDAIQEPNLNPVGPFVGVPFLLKDLGACEAGRKQELGSRLAEGIIAEKDSFLTTQFKNTGVNIIGRTSCPEFALSGATESVISGITRNPWALDLMAGGSSGGAAAAVAVGIVPIAHANDGGGSIRIPSSCCGLVGLKPSRGRVSGGPDMFEPLMGLASEFIVSRSVRDSVTMLESVSKPAIGEPFIISPLGTISKRSKPLNIGFTTGPWADGAVDPEIKSLTETIAKLCGDLGHRIVEVPFEFDFERYEHATCAIWAADLVTGVDALASHTGRTPIENYLETVTLAFYEHGKKMSGADFVTAQLTLNELRLQVGEYFTGFDVLLTPTLALPPQKHGLFSQNLPNVSAHDFFARLSTIEQFQPVFNITGQPAISLPLCENSEGLPIGMQFSAHFGREDILLSLAMQLEQALPWSDRRPKVEP
ncbi:MAG: amidase family protein [Litorimonas sp.]